MENNLLKLNSNKSYRLLGWKNLLSFNKTISYTVDWYKNYKFNKKNLLYFSQHQIKSFQN